MKKPGQKAAEEAKDMNRLILNIIMNVKEGHFHVF